MKHDDISQNNFLNTAQIENAVLVVYMKAVLRKIRMIQKMKRKRQLWKREIKKDKKDEYIGVGRQRQTNSK